MAKSTQQARDSSIAQGATAASRRRLSIIFALCALCTLFSEAVVYYLCMVREDWYWPLWPAIAAATIVIMLPVAVTVRVMHLGFANVMDHLHRRADSEHEQILIRIFVVLIILIYLVVLILSGAVYGERIKEVHVIVAAGLALQVFGWGLLLHLLYRPHVSPVRRIIGMIADNMVLTVVLAAGEAMMAPWTPIYLWVTFGNGFRYGRRYLFLSALASVIGFSWVVWSVPIWHDNMTLASGILIGLIVLPVYVSTLIKKLSDAKALAEEANRAKGRFLATMSHELRTPLNAVIGMTDVLRDTRLDREQQEMAATIKTSARSLLSLINDILDFSKIEAGKMAIETVDFDLHEMVAGVRNMLMQQTRGRDIRLGVHVTARTPYLLRGDAQRLQEVLINLVANALKFTEHGSVTVVIDAIEQSFSSARLRIEVRDTGIGIAQSKLDRIFDSFTQADESVNRQYGGTGLGLAISRQIVETMGGRIGVESREGQGSVFWVVVDLPKQQVQKTEPRRLSNLDDKIVIVSTDHLVARSLAEMIFGFGLRPVISDNPYQPLADLPSVEAGERGRAILVVDELGLGVDLDRFSQRLVDHSRGMHVQLIVIAPEKSSALSDDRALQVSASIVASPVQPEHLFNALHALQAGSLPDKPFGETSKKLSRQPKKALSILVAEDNRTNRRVLAKILERAGHKTTMVGNGEEALDALDRKQFDLVLMDVNMPGMSGIEAAKMFQFTNMGGPEVPIVALSADVTPETQKACEEAGMEAFLTKPIEAAQLLDTIEKLVPQDEPEEPELARPTPVAADKIATHPRFHAGNEPAIDRQAIAGLRQLDSSDTFLEEVVHDFIEDAEYALARMNDSLEANSVREFRDYVHALRSSSANIGAVRIFNLCMEINGLGAHEFERRGAEYVRQFEEEFRRARAELHAVLASGRQHESTS